ncbi:MAG: HAD hydrolase-like protein [Chloroflexota bacterium]|nr:HAD hydrolase-like protein [Chloroflexota bacterium]
MLELDVLIFDIDGVLIDVSESYRKAIRQTPQIYLESIMGLSPCNRDLVSREEVAALKLAGGFNNDWDATAVLVKYFLAQLDVQPGTPRPQTAKEIIASIRQAGKHIHTSVESLRRRKDIPAFAAALRAQGGGLAAARKILGDRNDHLLAADLVKRIFEEIYLGDELFAREYGEPPQVQHGDGLIRRESLIPDLHSLISLSHRVALGIATGRPRNEATYALEVAGIAKYFRALVAHEDIVAAEQAHFESTGQRVLLGKPHPFTLREAARRITRERARCAYIGDTLDDVRATNAAKAEMDFVSIACLAPAEDKPAMRREFERIGADLIVERPDELVEMIQPRRHARCARIRGG